MKAVVVRLPFDLAERLEIMSWVLRLPQSEIVRQAIGEAVGREQ